VDPNLRCAIKDRDYFKELAYLRGELIGYLMSRNTALAGHYINLIEKFQKEHPQLEQK
jgi:hypothetical protein